MVDASFPDPTFRGPDAHDRYRQRILNERPIPARRHQQRWTAPRPVTARVVWETDGEELRRTTASHWARVEGDTVVLVEVVDRRYAALGVWLELGDVRPR